MLSPFQPPTLLLTKYAFSHKRVYRVLFAIFQYRGNPSLAAPYSGRAHWPKHPCTGIFPQPHKTTKPPQNHQNTPGSSLYQVLTGIWHGFVFTAIWHGCRRFRACRTPTDKAITPPNPSTLELNQTTPRHTVSQSNHTVLYNQHSTYRLTEQRHSITQPT